jgi:8-oxo-dGTP diphosphatase
MTGADDQVDHDDRDDQDDQVDPDGAYAVRASGGAILRSRDEGLEIFVVHRPRYDDWTLPKGKREAGETDLECGIREVLEETGFACDVGSEVARVTYFDHKGRSKLVRYWAMTVRSGAFAANDEVDVAQWVAMDEVADLLSYERDVEVVDAVTALVDRNDDLGLVELADEAPR